MSLKTGSLLTKLLYGSVCTPGQLQRHVDSPPLVLHSTISLQGNTWAGSFWDDGNVLVEERNGKYFWFVVNLSSESFSRLSKAHWFVTTNALCPRSSTYVCKSCSCPFISGRNLLICSTFGKVLLSPASASEQPNKPTGYFSQFWFLDNVMFLIVEGKGILHCRQIIGPVFVFIYLLLQRWLDFWRTF